jgi:C-terminal processing protease CtpA/Prc
MTFLMPFMYYFCPVQAAGADRYILDLRSNPGGLVSAGVEVASLWVDGDKPVFNVSEVNTSHVGQNVE